MTLTLSAASTGGAVTNMRLSWNGATWNGWTAYATTKSVYLPAGDGIKTIYVQFRDATGNVSPTFTDGILYETVPPSGTVTINNGAAATKVRTVTLALSAADASSGVTQMRLGWNGTTWGGWEAYATTRSVNLPAGAGTKSIFVQFKDAAANVSAVATDSIEYAP